MADLPNGQKLLTFVATKTIISRQEDKRPGKSKSKKERAEVIENILDILNDTRIKKEDLNSSMFLLISAIQNEPGEDAPYSTKALMMGSETSFYTPIAAMLEDPNTPDFFKKNIFLAVANTIVEMGPMGLTIGKMLGEFVEREMDGINCDCPKCQAMKKAKAQDINVN